MIDAGKTPLLITATAPVLFLVAWHAPSFVVDWCGPRTWSLRVSAETDQQGLDVSLRGERAYNM